MDDEVITNDPYPHGEILAVQGIFQKPAGDYEERQFMCAFERSAGVWKCIFLDELERDTHIFGVGDTPRAAFDSLINRHTILNGGVESEVVKRFLPFMRDHFDDEGDFHEEMQTIDKDNVPERALNDWVGDHA